jgi:hypothetical protein
MKTAGSNMRHRLVETLVHALEVSSAARDRGLTR